MTEHCPIAGECPFINKIEKKIGCLETRMRETVSMSLLRVLVGILIVLFGSILALCWAIKTDIGSIDKSVAINTQRTLSIEKQIENLK